MCNYMINIVNYLIDYWMMHSYVEFNSVKYLIVHVYFSSAFSKDLMEFLNPNSSDCTLVLFYTPWCRFSASLAPHFNSLPRAFPTLRFLALDASQHSR